MRTKLTNKKTPGNNSNKNKTNALEKLKFFTFVSVRVSYKDYILHTRCAVVVVGFFFFLDAGETRNWFPVAGKACWCVCECERARHRHDFSKPQGGRDSDSGCYSISQLSSSCLLTSKPKPKLKPSQSHRVASQSQAKSWLWPAVKEPKAQAKAAAQAAKPSSQVNSRQQGQQQNEPYWFFYCLHCHLLYSFPFPTNSLPSLLNSSVGLHIIANNSNRQKCYL